MPLPVPSQKPIPFYVLSKTSQPRKCVQNWIRSRSTIRSSTATTTEKQKNKQKNCISPSQKERYQKEVGTESCSW